MKRILITGQNGYIGTHLAAYLSSFPDRYEVVMLPMKGHTPDEYAFRGADAIVHTAAIVHQKESKETLPLYDAVNRGLTIALAEKAKREGVKQFVFFSSMSVYGMDTGTITEKTVPAPKTAYGRSKLEAETAIAPLADDGFFITILRPPMVIGSGAKGNPARLSALAKKLPFCPDFQNRRSMVSIETLCRTVKDTLDKPLSGIVFPQEREPLSTAALMEQAKREQGKAPKKTKLFNPAIRVLRACTRVGKKAFGDLVYEGLYKRALPLPKGKEEPQ
ncbi:MAG: NAD-dependent epimerase/dehydratase family protein [Clostridia bacterium]|nr:NAD-dependent epimerase/dehydratase family protein [Clostridia bacterium]